MKGIKIKIIGQVQGISFRKSAQEKAHTLNLTGWVQNEADGSVYIQAEGKEEDLKEFLDWCYQGYPLAEVEKVEYNYYSKLENFSSFKIRT